MNLEKFKKVKESLVKALRINPYKAHGFMRKTGDEGKEYRCCLCVIQDTLACNRETSVNYTGAENSYFNHASEAIELFEKTVPEFPICFYDEGEECYVVDYISATDLNDEYGLPHKLIANCVNNLDVKNIEDMEWEFFMNKNGDVIELTFPLTLSQIRELY